jgi:hypothetical protein
MLGCRRGNEHHTERRINRDAAASSTSLNPTKPAETSSSTNEVAQVNAAFIVGVLGQAVKAI